MKDKAPLLESLRGEGHLLRAVWGWKIDLAERDDSRFKPRNGKNFQMH